MNTDARRKSSAAYHAKRTEEGLRKVTLWLSPEARFKLDALKAAAGSKDKAADAAILAWDGPNAPGDLRVMPITDSPLAWPSGAVLLPEHTSDPGPDAPLRVAPAVHVVVPKLERKAFNPQPKTGKAKGK